MSTSDIFSEQFRSSAIYYSRIEGSTREKAVTIPWKVVKGSIRFLLPRSLFLAANQQVALSTTRSLGAIVVGGAAKSFKSMALLSAVSSSILNQDPSTLYSERLKAMGLTESDPLAPKLFCFECRCPVDEIYLEEVVQLSFRYSFHFRISVFTLFIPFLLNGFGELILYGQGVPMTGE